MKPARNTSPDPVVSTAFTAKPGDAQEPVAVERDGPVAADRHHQQPRVLAPEPPQRALVVALAGQLLGQAVGEDGARHGEHEFLGPLGHPVEVARDRDAQAPARAAPPRSPPPGPRRRRGGDAPRRSRRPARRSRAGARDSSRSQSTARSPVCSSMTMTADWFRPGLGTRASDVEPCASEFRAHAPAVLVVADGADVEGPQAEPRARRHRRRRLAAAGHQVPAHPHLRVPALRLRERRDDVHEVHRVGAETDDVPAGCEAHADRPSSRRSTAAAAESPASAARRA